MQLILTLLLGVIIVVCEAMRMRSGAADEQRTP